MNEQPTQIVDLQSNRSLGSRVTARALVSMLESGGGLDDTSKKLIIDALSAQAEPSAADRQLAGSSRHSFRAAIAWLRQAPGRLKNKTLARLSDEKEGRPGSYQRRRPTAKPFNPRAGRWAKMH
jgi:hypothetical protein